MAVAGLLALLDDISLYLDDVALLTKVASKKTAGVLGDDLALNAQQVAGVSAERELPVVWAVARGSLWNKVILVPLALVLSYFAPWLIAYLLMLGGAYLCYEGFEKLAHRFLHRSDVDRHANEMLLTTKDTSKSMLEFERAKIRGAIRTDFILSAEIIVIALGTMRAASFEARIIALSSIALLATVGVYGIVAAIVRLDDIALRLMRRDAQNAFDRVLVSCGRGLLWFCPLLMKTLSALGMLAMFLVGGGILLHEAPFLQDLAHHLELHPFMAVPWLQELSLSILSGLLAGAILVLLHEATCLLIRLFGRKSPG